MPYKCPLFLSLLAAGSFCFPPALSQPCENTAARAQDVTWTSSTAITFHPIGILHSPYKEEKGTPLYSTPAGGTRAKVVVFPEYVKGLKDLEGFSHVWLIAYFDRARPWKPVIVPHRDTKEHGLFATRCPARPNAIGLSVVKLTGVKDNEVEVEGVDILDNTPILDIKPYLPDDAVGGVKCGWIENASGANKKSAEENGRFVK
jgi:tRNA (adenine37-N6)-methyltransferase